MADIQVTVDLSSLAKLQQDLANIFTASSALGDVAMRQWGMRLRSFWQERFAEQSRGGGDWPKLSPVTVRQKIKQSSRTPDSILRRFGPMFHSLDAVYSGLPGQYQARLPDGFEFGIGGPGAYPSGVTIAQVVSWHQEGSGRNPKRPVIVAPTQQVIDGMADDLRRAVIKLIEAR